MPDDQAPVQSRELIIPPTLTPAVLFAPGGVESILGKIEAEVRAAHTDISTVGGRKEIASLAYKVARSKTALDDMGKQLVDEWKKKAAVVDAERRTIRERLDALKDEVRKPLTDWEDAEKNRIADHEQALARLASATHFDAIEPTAAEINARLDSLRDLMQRDWQEFAKRADETRTTVETQLKAKLVAQQKREAERAEL
jgi:colicin import membrane protein